MKPPDDLGLWFRTYLKSRRADQSLNWMPTLYILLGYEEGLLKLQAEETIESMRKEKLGPYSPMTCQEKGIFMPIVKLPVT